jgi:hypothetical protein
MGKIILIVVVLLLNTDLYSQVFLTTDDEAIIVYEIDRKDTIVLDSVFYFYFFHNYSFIQKNKKLYITYYSSDVARKISYYIDIMNIKEDMKVDERYIITEYDYPNFFENNISITLSDEGINLLFKKGIINKITFGYQILTRNQFSKSINSLSEFYIKK